MKEYRIAIEGLTPISLGKQLLAVGALLAALHIAQVSLHAHWMGRLAEHLADNVEQMRAHAERLQLGLSKSPGSMAPFAGGLEPLDGRHQVIRTVQQRLNEKGFYKGSIDGRLNLGTALAVEGLKRANGVKIESDSLIIDSSTLFLLGLSGSRPPER